MRSLREWTRRRKERDRLKAWVILISFTVIFSEVSHGQVAAEFAPSGRKSLGARDMSLGDAIGSDACDIEAMYQNPATLSFLRNPGVLFDQRHELTAGVFQENIAARLFANRVQAFGLGVGIEHGGKLTKNTQFNFMQFDVDAAYSVRILGLSPDLSFGLLGNIRREKDDSLVHSAAGIAVGVFYSPSSGTSYSIVYRGIGTNISYVSLPSNDRFVTSGQVDRMDGSLEFGSTLKFPYLTRSPFLIISIAAEKDFVTRVLSVRGGFEAILINVLSVRLGFVNSTVKEVRFGLGLSVSRFTLDYATMAKSALGRFDEFTLKLAL